MLEIFYHDGNDSKEISLEELKKIHPIRQGILWIDLTGHTAEEAKSILVDLYQFHPLTVEDCGSFIDHPKIDDYDDYLFIVFHSLYYHEEEMRISTWELDFFVGPHYVITNHLKPIPYLPDVKKLFKEKHPALARGHDFLVQYIMDKMVNYNLPMLKRIGRKLVETENEVLTTTEHDTISDIYKIKRNLSIIRNVIHPQIDVLAEIMKYENKYFSPDCIVYFNDTINQMEKVRNVVRDYIDMCHAALDAHLSISSYKMNNIIKRLTLIMTVFMPLTVLAGMGGMSEWTMMTGADNWRFAYPLFLLGLGGVGVVTYYILKWLKWV